jgi:hypothetical protein
VKAQHREYFFTSKISKILSWILCLLIPLPLNINQLTHANEPPTRQLLNPSPSNPTTPELELTSPNVHSEITRKIESILGELNSTPNPQDLSPNENSRSDTFHISDQVVCVEGKFYPLKDDHLEIPLVGFNKMNIEYDKATQTLSFVAIRHKKVVAKHIIPNISVAAWTEDEEHIVFLSQDGKLTLIDKFLLYKISLFKSPIPLFQNIASQIPMETEMGAKLKLAFRVPGIKPFEELEATHPDNKNIVIPRDEKGEPIVSSKDLIVYSESPEGDYRKLHGIYSKDILYSKVEQGILVLSWLVYLSYLHSANGSEIEELVKAWSSQENLASPQDFSPETRRAISQFRPTTLYLFAQRFSLNKTLSNRNFDLVKFETWQQQFLEISTALADQTRNPDKTPKLSAELLEKMRGDLQNPNYISTWRSLVAQNENPHTLKKLSKALLGLAGLVGLGLGAHYGLQNIPENLQHTQAFALAIKTTNWIYSFWPSEIFANKEYRHPLLLSVTSLLSTIPLGLFISWASIPLFKFFSKITQKPFPRLSTLFYDIYEKYKDVSLSKRVVTFFMRGCAWITLPIQHIFFENLLKQNTLFPSIRRGLNIFQTVKKDSPLGSSLNLTQDHRVGFQSVSQHYYHYRVL